MAGSTFGKIIQLSTFGESHGVAIGGVLQGIPAGLELDTEKVQDLLDKRTPGQSRITTQRKESDTVQWLSGIFEGKTTGTPIGFVIHNQDQRSKDYSHIKDQFRPSHADFTYHAKYGHRDYRGGGRSSARETACRVVAGAVCMQVLEQKGIEVIAYVQRVQNTSIPDDAAFAPQNRYDNDVRCPHVETAAKMFSLIDSIRKEGDTVGGEIVCLINGVPAGLGEPVFHKLHADLGSAMLGINAVKSFEIGSGKDGTYLKGSQHNDLFTQEEGSTVTATNKSGGIQGGISNGQQITMSIGFKPVATIMKDQDSVNKDGEKVTVKGKGRHDPCVLPRAVPIVESMAALVIADHLMLSQSNRMDQL